MISFTHFLRSRDGGDKIINLNLFSYIFIFSELFETNACSHLSDQDLEGALKALEGQDQLDPREVAIVKYTPSAENPHADYADEVYYPPIDSETQAIRDIILPQNAVDCKMNILLFNINAMSINSFIL